MILTDIHKQNAKRRLLWWCILTFGEIGIFVLSHEIGYQAYRAYYGPPEVNLSWGLYIHYFLYLYIGVVIFVGLAGVFIKRGTIAYYLGVEILFLGYFCLSEVSYRPHRSLLLFASTLAGIILPWVIVSIVLRTRRSWAHKK